MCILLVAAGPLPELQAPKLQLVLAFNRDEAFSRPTEPLHVWEDGILAGRDMRGGGTWFGVAPGGRIAALTNNWGHEKLNAPTRGTLVLDFLRSGDSVDAFIARISGRASEMSGFNLLVGESLNGVWRLRSFSNVEQRAADLPPGIHGIGNGPITDEWPRVSVGKAALRAALQQSSAAISQEAMFEALRSEYGSGAPAIPGAEESSSSIRNARQSLFIPPLAEMGTRSSSVCLIHQDGRIEIEERTYDRSGMSVHAAVGWIKPDEVPVAIPVGVLPVSRAIKSSFDR